MIVIDWRAFGEQVHLARRRLKLSQAEFAKAVGISRNYVSMIERGVADPSYTIVLGLCQYLGMELPKSVVPPG
jgi:transcriptional regulator with XRE-family HTH domain